MGLTFVGLNLCPESSASMTPRVGFGSVGPVRFFVNAPLRVVSSAADPVPLSWWWRRQVSLVQVSPGGGGASKRAVIRT